MKTSSDEPARMPRDTGRDKGEGDMAIGPKEFKTK